MRSFAVSLSLLLAFSVHAGSPGFPIKPDSRLTPGSLCHRADEIRYPEGIIYCRRDVEVETKLEVIRNYDQQLGYTVRQMSRGKFKIDHFIPLCMGGANSMDNLWPQHESIYKVTDQLEADLCEKMAEGRLLQEDAVHMIKEAKLDLKMVPRVYKELDEIR